MSRLKKSGDESPQSKRSSILRLGSRLWEWQGGQRRLRGRRATVVRVGGAGWFPLFIRIWRRVGREAVDDDDYYAPPYLATMVKWLDEADLVGEVGARYYFLQDQAYYHWAAHEHASLCRTGMTRRVLKTLEHVLSKLRRGEWRIDLELWGAWRGSSKLVPSDPAGRAMSVGMKQLSGREGVTWRRYSKAKSDPARSKLREWLGDDWPRYRRWCLDAPADLVTYTAVFGGYDAVQPAPAGCECVAFTDGSCRIDPSWKTIRDNTFSSPKRANRYHKMHSHQLFPGATTLYVDGNIRCQRSPRELASHLMRRSPESSFWMFKHNRAATIKDEVTEILRLRFAERSQVDTELVRANGQLPVAWGGCLLRDASSAVAEVNSRWWDLFNAGGYARDQVLLPIALRDSGITYCMVDEPTPFYGETSEWLSVTPHLKPRVVRSG